MSRFTPTLIATLLCLNSGFVEAEEKGQSVMFAPKQPEVDLTPADTGHSTGDRCEALLQEAESLKGKPQRKHTVLERYRLECSQSHSQ
ncbi:MAG: hypothetical protein ABW076_11215 [Candidatus Thiodiazotropha sp.]